MSEKKESSSRRPYPYRSRGPRPASPTVQILLEAALDVLGALCVLALLQGLGLTGLTISQAWLICLGVAGLDLILRTSLRKMALWVLALPVRGVQALAQARRRPSTTPTVSSTSNGPETELAPVPEFTG